LSKTKIMILTVALFFLFASFASANEFYVSLRTIENNIFLDEVAYFDITIRNTRDNEETYQIYSPDISWIIDTNPNEIKVNASDKATFLVKIDPKTHVSVGQHRVILNIREVSSKDLEQINVPIYVKSSIPDTRTYEPSIELNVDMPQKIDPREKVQIGLHLRNRNNLDIPNLKVRIQSNLMYKEYEMPIGGLNESTDDVSFTLNPMTPPQQDTLVVTLLKDNKTVNTIRKSYEIVPYSELVENVDEKKIFLGKEYKIQIKNNGNTENSGQFKQKSNFFRSLVTFSNPKAIKTEDQQGYLVWEYTLAPEEIEYISIVYLYGIYIYTIIVIIIIIILYYILRSPLTVKKEAKVVGSFEEGASEIKVMIHLKNRSQKEIENIRITEKIPRLVKFEKKSYVGTLAPDKIIEHAKIGTTIRWNIKAIEPYEERIITYRIKSKLNIVGGFTLPKVIIRFETNTGKDRVINSNRSKIIAK
jgi:hypothetical protein